MADIRRITLTLVVTVGLALGACGDDDDTSPPPSTTTTTSTTAAAPSEAVGSAEVEAFCAEMERLDVETSEDYVGSAQHLSDVDALLAVAPDEIRPAVGRFREFVASGQITDDPDSKDLEGWPPDVQADVAAIRDLQEASC
jgi:hypothetical protein